MYMGITQISSKDQIVISAEIRKRLHIKPRDRFLVFGKGEEILFRRISELHEKPWEELTRPFRNRAKELGIIREDVAKAIREVRAERRK